MQLGKSSWEKIHSEKFTLLHSLFQIVLSSSLKLESVKKKTTITLPHTTYKAKTEIKSKILLK